MVLLNNRMGDCTPMLGEGMPVKVRDFDEPTSPSKPDHAVSTNFGWPGFQPKCLQFLSSFRWYLFIVSCCCFVQGMIVNGLVSISISSIEKRFNLSSLKSGIFAITYDIAVTAALPVLQIRATKTNKARYIGYGMFLVGLGGVLTGLPQFIESPYDVGEIKSEHCDITRTGLTCGRQQSVNPVSYPLLLVAQALIGIGAAPIFTYGYSTLDEFDSHERTSVNMAFFMGSGTVGPAIAFLMGGLLLNQWGDMGKTTPEQLGIQGPHDPRWYGAWWAGFVICGLLCFVLAIPQTMFPKKLKDTDERKKNDTTQTHKDLIADFTGEKWEILKVTRMILGNGTCVSLIILQTIESLLMNGYITFVPKLFENLFGLTSSGASVTTGLIIVPMGAIGSLVGAAIGRFFNGQMKRLLQSAIVLNVLIIVCAISFRVECPRMEIAGITQAYLKTENKSGLDGFDQCNHACNCEGLFDPVCSPESSMSYLSPCHAGCGFTPEISPSNWTTCGCVASGNPHSLVTKGWCKVECTFPKYLFYVCFSLMALFIFALAPVIQNAGIRVVAEAHRDSYICISWIFMRILGSIPGAILFGAVFDRACRYWLTSCDGSSKCALYDAHELGSYIFFFTIVCKLAILVCLFVALRTYTPCVEDDTGKTQYHSMDSSSVNVSGTSDNASGETGQGAQ